MHVKITIVTTYATGEIVCCGMPLVASPSSMRRKLRMWFQRAHQAQALRRTSWLELETHHQDFQQPCLLYQH
jgi:hypothetical protein